MKIILVDDKHGGSRTLVLKGWMKACMTLCLLGLPVVLGYLGYHLANVRAIDSVNSRATQAWMSRLEQQELEILNAKQEAETQIAALTQRLASLQARLLRLDALGERLTQVAEIDASEFNFSQEPAVGGPELPWSMAPQRLDIMTALDELALQVENRHQQLEILDGVFFDRKTQADTFIAGRPITKGWMSSAYGRRIDPFTGNVAWHQGIDFATGEEGQDVISVAAGVVTFAGTRAGYGNLVEINHGNGYETRYAHSRDILVKTGEIVKKGQVIALSGTTGRSTGPHVHFEVHKNGRVVDPAAYIHRTSR